MTNYAASMSMIGLVLYGLFLVLILMFWLYRAGRSLQQMIDQNAVDHHHVHRVITEHPIGGVWSRHRAWMDEEE